MMMQLQVEVPERTVAQRMQALERANRVRSCHAQLKREIERGERTATGVLLEPPELSHSMKVADLLLAVPKYGKVKVNKILVQCRVSPSKTVGGLTLRQRAEIAAMLGRR